MKIGKIVLLISWIVAVGLLAVITVVSQKRVTQFMGLTESKEKIINFPYSVQLKKLYILPGQKVKKGETIAKIIKTDIYTNKINSIDFQIDELSSKSKLKISKLEDDIKRLDLKKNSDILQIKNQISELKRKDNEKREKLSSLSGIQKKNIKSSISYELNALLKKIKYLTKYTKSKINTISKQIETEKKLTKDNVNRLLQKKKVILEQEAQIDVKAPIDGAVGSIKYNEYESIKPYETLLTLHGNYPKYVTGFVHENIADHLKIGQEIEIEYVTDKYKSNIGVISGQIETVSSRIVNFPVRLKKYKIVPLWGYKVLIKLPKNDLKLGQKVMISTQIKKDAFEAKLSKILQFLKLK